MPWVLLIPVSKELEPREAQREHAEHLERGEPRPKKNSFSRFTFVDGLFSAVHALNLPVNKNANPGKVLP